MKIFTNILKYCAITISIVFVVLFAVSSFYSFLTHNSEKPKIKTSVKEEEFFSKLKEDCLCEVKFLHDHRVSKNSTSQIEKSGDYSFLISLTNYENYKKYILIGNKNYKNLSNRDSWCQKDTIFQKNKVKEIVDGFLEVSEYAFLYDKINIRFAIYENVGEEEELTQNKCDKYFEYNIKGDNIKYTEFN